MSNDAKGPYTPERFDALAVAYRPLIFACITQVRRQPQYALMEGDDLAQEGYLALWMALHQYRPELNTYFGVYLKKAILNRMKTLARNWLPHHYQKDGMRDGKPVFRRVAINVDGFEDVKRGNW